MKHRVGVRVMPRDVILDTQGRAVETSLKLMKMEAAKVRVGKWIELEIDAASVEAARDQARKIAEALLHNPLLESYEVESL